jgi:flagellar hook-associated protein 2
MIYESVDGVDSSVNSLSRLGIEMDDSGHLSLDTGKLTSAMEEHPDDVVRFFSSDEEGNKGMALRLYDFLDGYLKSSTGILSAKTDGLQKSIDKIEDQVERIEFRLAKREENLRHQFNTLEDLMLQFQQTSSQLDQQLSSLANLRAYISKGK